MEIECLSVAKELAFPESNEDRFATSAARDVCALSDGASESFDSKAWAQVLCDVFVEGPLPHLDCDPVDLKHFFGRCRDRFALQYRERSLSWSQQMAFDRGNFGTLVGVREKDETVEVWAIGDSVAIWFDAVTGGLESHFLKTSEAFIARPNLVSSLASDDDFFFGLDADVWQPIAIQTGYIKDRKMYLLTDAIGHYVCRLHEAGELNAIEEIFNLNEAGFEKWVSSERANRTLKVDDTTMLKVTFA